MDLKTITLALAAAIASPVAAQESEPTFTFECIAQDYDGEYLALFETAQPMLIPLGGGLSAPTSLGNTISMHSYIIDPHHFLTDADTLPDMIVVNDTVSDMPNMTEEALQTLSLENAEVNKAIEAMAQSLELGVALPSCDAVIS